MLDQPARITNPKPSAKSGWYPYYAGFSEEFVEDALRRLNLFPRALVLDPWNGAGTTTAVCARAGYRAIGTEINPALVFVGKARSASVAHWLPTHQLIRALDGANLNRAVENCPILVESDPLRVWFGPSATRSIRALEWIGLKAFQPSSSGTPGDLQLANLRFECALWYVALFLTVRKLIEPTAGTNPTWIKALEKSQVLKPQTETVRQLFATALTQVGDYIKRSSIEDAWSRTSVLEATSIDMSSIQHASVDAIITSPPYCTRIDYAVYCAPELAVLGPRVGVDVHTLRNEMIGSPLVGSARRVAGTWGPEAGTFLDAVWAHPSKASQGYYFNYFLKYFDAMQKSVLELSRVARQGCETYLVLQSSFYKDLYLDLPTIVTEMFVSVGWQHISRDDFSVTNSFSMLNPKARAYAKSRKAIESVIRLRATGG